MQVTVTFRHVDPSDALRDYLNDKIKRVTKKYLRNAESAQAFLRVNKHRHEAEINIHAASFDISARESTGDLYSAIDLAIDKVESQLRKHKDRINKRKVKSGPGFEPTMIPVEVIEHNVGDDSETPQVIETDNMPAKPLSIEDAVLQLELSDAAFLVFLNSASESISVVYRRNDGNYGLITPNA